MSCEFIPTEHGTMVICSRGVRRKGCEVPTCQQLEVALCDWPVTRKGKKGTCDLRLCSTHRWKVPGAKDSDYCPAHQKLHEQQTPRLPGF